jgi:plasmid stability protein
MAKANVTITIDDEVLQRARLRALQQGTSVNAVVRETLEAYAGAADSRTRAIERLLEISRRSRSRRGRRRWTRDDLHDR